MSRDTLAAMSRLFQSARGLPKRCIGAAVATVLCVSTFTNPSSAHIALDSPKSGVTLAVGGTVVITWEDTILHEGIGYDLDLVDASRRAQSTIVHGLPTSQHRYDWLVPDVLCVGCYVVVMQDNVDHDYFDSALVSIYGKPVAAGGGGGTDGSPEMQGGMTNTAFGGGGSSAAGAPSGGSGATVSVSAAGRAGGSAAIDLGPAGTIDETAGGAAGAAPARPAESPPLLSAGAGGDGDESEAGDAPESSPDPTASSSNAEGCAVDRRAPSPLGLYLTCVASCFAFMRKRRALRSRI